MRYIYHTREIDGDDASVVGKEGARLGELTRSDIPIPPSFVVSTHAYFHFLRENHLLTKIEHLLAHAHFERPEAILQLGSAIKKLIIESTIDDQLAQEIFHFYHSLGTPLRDALVNIHPSLTVENVITSDLKQTLEPLHDVSGEANVLIAIKEAWASLFTPQEILRRHHHGIEHFRVGVAVVIQEQMDAEVSGVMVTSDPMTNDRTKVIIEAFFGLTGHVNHHAITPDHYAVTKNTLTILSTRVANQTVTLRKVDNAITEVLLTPTQGGRQKLSPQQISDLTLLGKKIEQFAYFPQHVEWIFSKNAFFITKLTQATIHLHAFTTDDKSVETSPLLGSGIPGSSGIASGPVRIVTSHHDIAKVESGDVVVAKHTDHTYNAALKKAKAIITEQGGRMSHTGIIARGIGIPAVVNMEHATSILKNGHIVQVNGSTGQVYFGGKKAHVIHHPPSAPDSTATKIFVSVPQASPTHDLLDIDGAELSGSRLIQEIGTHPKRAVEEGKSKEFSKLLADKIAEYCDVFSPRPVIYELSNLTTDEYRSLVGGRDFEPDEKNAHLGYRGILRHLSDPSLLQVELDALSLVRNGRNMKNVSLLIPHVRTLNELIALKEKLTRAGFYRNPSFKLWLRADTPATGLLLEKYIHVGIDGISIDTDSLTTLVLGADRKNNDIAHHYNELDEAVLLVIEQMIKKAREYSLPVLVSGSAVTLHTTLTEKLVEWGVYGVCITHLNHSPVKRHIAITEKKLIS